MPYSKITELPDRVKDNLPKQGQEIYKESYNSAFDQYKDTSKRRGDEGREETSQKVAWNAVKQKYKKDENGNWKKR